MAIDKAATDTKIVPSRVLKNTFIFLSAFRDSKIAKFSIKLVLVCF